MVDHYVIHNFRNHPSVNTRFEMHSSDPATPLEGRYWFNTDSSIPYIRANGLNLPLIAKDDNFYNAPEIASNDVQDALLVWSHVAVSNYQFGKYRRISYANLKAQFGSVNNAFKTISGNTGTNIVASGEDTLAIWGDGSVIETSGNHLTNRLQMQFKSQLQHSFFAGPSSGGSGAPSFRKILLSDLPAALPVYWDDIVDKPLVFPSAAHTHLWSNVLDSDSFSVEDWAAYTQSAGRVYGGNITDNGDGTVAITAGAGIIKLGTATVTDCPCTTGLASGQLQPLKYIEWGAVLSLPLIDNAYTFIYVRGSDNSIQTTNDFYSIDFANDFTIGRAYRMGITSLVRLCGTNIWNFNRRVQLFGEERFPVERARGLIISDAGSRQFGMTEGILWAELVNRFTIAAKLPAANFSYLYRDGLGGWTTVLTNVINNIEYDNNTGTPVAFGGGPGRWRTDWVYVTHDGTVYVIMGQQETTSLSSAETVPPPGSLPGQITAYGSFVGRIIIQKSTTTLFITSAFTTFLGYSAVSNHSDLGGLGNDDHLQYYNEARGDARYAKLDATNQPFQSNIKVENKISDSAVIVHRDVNPTDKVCALGAGTSGSIFQFDESGYWGIHSASKATILSGLLTGDVRFRIDGTTGYVGIGKIATEMLDVNGNIIAHNLSGTNTGDQNLSGYEPVLGNPLVDGYVLSSTTLGVRSWIDFPVGISFGLEHQIPYTNATVDDFNYSSKFSWNNTAGVLLIDQTLRSPDSTGIGSPAKDLIIQAGDGWPLADNAGNLYLSYGKEDLGGVIYIGMNDLAGSGRTIIAAGSSANVGLTFSAKGNGGVTFAGAGGISLNTGSLSIVEVNIGLGGVYLTQNLLGCYNESDFIISPWSSSDAFNKGYALKLIGGQADNNDEGGNVLIYGGKPNIGGTRGNVYFGDGSNGYLPAKSAETNVVYYDTTTGKLSYGAATTGISETATIITDVRNNAGQMQKKTRTLTFVNGVVTSAGAESAWTDTTDI